MRLIPTIFGLAWLLVGLVALTGCSFYSGADPNRGTAALIAPDLPEDTWPARVTGEFLTDLDAITPEAVSLTIPYRAGAAHRNEDDSDDNGRSQVCRLRASITAHGVYGRGLIRLLDSPIPEEGSRLEPGSLIVPDELLGGIQFDSMPRGSAPTGENLTRFRQEQPERYKRLLQRRLGLRQGSGESWSLSSSGTWMRLYQPSGKWAGQTSRGLVVHLSSLAGLEFELPIVGELTSRGWAVLIINASTARRDEPPVFVNPDGDLTQPAGRLAAMIDNRVAEIAYAAEAGVEFISEHYHSVQTSNVVVIGYSAGALTAPAVAELLRDRVAAVVLVGGGANLLDISQRSSLTNGGIELIWKDGKKSPESVRKLNESYLVKSKLDPYILAPRLRCKPVLMLHGAFDDIIPADTGAVLRTRLGKCECFTFTLGHRGIFFFLPGQANRIASWLDEQTSP